MSPLLVRASSGMCAAVAGEIARHWREHGTCPSKDEIAAAVNYAPRTVRNTLAWMSAKGLLVRVGWGTYMTPEDYRAAIQAIRGGDA